MPAQPSPLKRILVPIALAAGLAVGAAGVAAAVSDPGSPPDSSNRAGAATDDQQHDPNYQSSVTIPDQLPRGEADEARALQAAAKISGDQARQAALAVVPGTAGNVSLDNENGNVVYSIEITGTDAAVTDVKIDAGNGTVLAKDTPNHESDSSDGHPDNAAGASESSGR